MSLPTHVPVMVNEIVEMLPLRPKAVVVDGTLGLAGHSVAMGSKIPGGMLVGLDWDEQMIERAKKRLAEELSEVDVHLYHADYRALPECLTEACEESGRPSEADAVLLDMGVNNAHFEDPSRGFSFKEEAPLDMRMDKSSGETAAALLNRSTATEIENILWNFGDERWARKISQVIVERRKTAPLKTTADLVDCVNAAIPAAKRDKRIHPATRAFMGLRIAVNHELDGLEDAVTDAAKTLAPGGVMAVLTYHSGEDRAVKTAFRELAKSGNYEDLTRKPLVPSDLEQKNNPKSRSAKLRGLRRIKEDQS